MPELCQNCGAELYGGQQFCRRCGTPVSAVAPGGEAPTQILPEGAQPVPAAGVSQAGVETGPFGAQQPTAYHPRGGYQQTSPLVGQPFGSRPLAVESPRPPRRRRRGAWVAALLVVFLLGAGLATGGAYLWWRATRGPVIVKKINVPAVPDVPPMPGMPDGIGERIKEALKAGGVPIPVDESGALVSGDTTVLTRTYELDEEAAVALHSFKGGVTVTGGDGERVVVKITKQGGSAAERAGSPVLESKTDKGLTLFSAPGAGGAVSVSYEVTLPRGLRRLELSAQRGDVKVSEFDGELDVSVTNGSVSVAAHGAVRSRVVNGRTSVMYTGRHEEPQEFSVTNGDVDVFLTGSGQEVDLKAASTNGRIEVDDMIAVKAEKRGGGYRAEAELGGGGAPLNVKVINGNIRLKP